VGRYNRGRIYEWRKETLFSIKKNKMVGCNFNLSSFGQCNYFIRGLIDKINPQKSISKNKKSPRRRFFAKIKAQ
jgi:hypothetical protein